MGRYITFSIAIIIFNLSGVFALQSTSGSTGYSLLNSVNCLERGELMLSTWGSYITSEEFKGMGVFPLGFATGIFKRTEAFLSFSGASGLTYFDRGITLGTKFNIYNSNNIYPSAGILIESFNMENNPDIRISLLLEKPVVWNFTLLLSGGYAFSGDDLNGFTGSAGVLYGRIYPKLVTGFKTEDNFRANSVFLSGIFKLLERFYLTITSGTGFGDYKNFFATAGITYAFRKEKKLMEQTPTTLPEVTEEIKERVFPAPVPLFRLKLK